MFTGINVLIPTHSLKNSDVTIQKRNDNKNSAARKLCKLSKAFSHLRLFDSYFYRIICKVYMTRKFLLAGNSFQHFSNSHTQKDEYYHCLASYPTRMLSHKCPIIG